MMLFTSVMWQSNKSIIPPPFVLLVFPLIVTLVSVGLLLPLICIPPPPSTPVELFVIATFNKLGLQLLFNQIPPPPWVDELALIDMFFNVGLEFA